MGRVGLPFDKPIQSWDVIDKLFKVGHVRQESTLFKAQNLVDRKNKDARKIVSVLYLSSFI